ADGEVRQAGTPAEVYDQPVNPFVMRFLGPVTNIGDRLVRPHDLELSQDAEPGSSAAEVTRVLRLGFEVRVEMRLDNHDAWAQITRRAADRLSLRPGDTVYVRPNAEARTLAADAA
ncbi:MAG TPA: TOBE-like domain-containing protein, partial [Propionibacteriaceae bacterium]|nr:TOBE-like domain-containing protein [Propionibacteriaceae bacterium]